MLLRYAVDGDDLTARYRSRVVADGGVVPNYSDVQKIVQMLKNSGTLKNTKLLWYGGAGVKIRTSGVNSYVSKAYSVQLPANDLAQTTELSQPWQSGNIAPNEKPCLLNPNGGSRFMTHPAISFGATEAWSVSVCLDWNGHPTLSQYFAGNDTVNSALGVKAGAGLNYRIFNASGTGATGTISTAPIVGKKSIIHFIAFGNNKCDVYLNGGFVETLSAATNIVLSTLFTARSVNLSAKIHYYAIQSGALSASQVAAEYNTLRALIPERESITIGSQAWTTSNLDIVCDALGVVIPEVTDDSAWAALTTPAWCHYNNDPANGAIYGKLYNWYAVKQIDDALAATGSEWRVPTQAQFNTLATQLGGASVAGGKMKVAGTSYFASPNSGADNSSGFSALGSGWRFESLGTFSALNSLFETFASDQVDATQGKLYALSKDDAQLVNANISKKRGVSIRLVKNL